MTVSEQQSDYAELADQSEEQAAALNLKLRTRVRVRQAIEASALRPAARQALATDRSAQARKLERDRLLGEAIVYRLLVLTDHLKVGDLERADRTLNAIETDYVSQTQVRVECTRIFHVATMAVVSLDEIDPEILQHLRLLEFGIGDLRRMSVRQAGSTTQMWRRVAELIGLETDPLRQPLLEAQMSSETYAAQLAEAIETALNEFAPEETAERASWKRRLVEVIASGIGLNLASSALWEERGRIWDVTSRKSLSAEASDATATEPMYATAQPIFSPQRPLVPLWNVTVGGAILSSPVVADGVVYIGSSSQVATRGSIEWTVYALEASTGQTLWNIPTRDLVAYSPVVADGVVYVGNKRGNLHALEARTGRARWNVAANVAYSPVVADGVVYIGSYDGNLYALEASTGQVRWKTPTRRPVISTPVVVDGVVYVVTDDSNVYAVEARTGRMRWNVASEGLPKSAPVVADGVVYGSNDHRDIYALEASTGRTRWNVAANVASAPVVADGVVYIGSYDGNLYALEASTGQVRWTFAMQGSVIPKLVVDGALYVGTTRGNLYALEASTGQIRWNVAVGWATLAPAVVDGVVYVGKARDAHLYALEASTGQVRWNVPTGGSVSSRPVVVDGVVYITSSGSHVSAIVPGA